MSVAKRRIERDDEDLVRLYLHDIGQHPLLTKDDEIRLAQAIEAGTAASEALEAPGDGPSPSERRALRRAVRAGADAHDAFVLANLRLVVSIAKKYQASGLPLLDLVQEGNLGLIHAVAKFDWRKGFKFSTYATWWIRQAISRGISNSSRVIRLPVHASDHLVALQRIRGELAITLGRTPTRAELAAALDLPEDKVAEIMRFAVGPLSLSEPIGDDTTELGDLVEDQSVQSPYEAAALALLPREVAALLGVLDEREQLIISLRFGLDRGEPRTLAEVGDEFNLTRERIRQIEAKAMSKLRHPAFATNIHALIEG